MRLNKNRIKRLAIILISLLCLKGFSQIKAQKSMTAKDTQEKTIYFAGGCFWGTEHFFKQVRGVVATEVGYANGNIQNPTYEDVKTDTTGFAETVKVIYDPEVISLELLLDLFYKTIEPTSLNRQGGDIGSQYRTGIYYTTAEDEAIIRASLSNLAKAYEEPLQVECEPLRNFYSGEDYHQDYLDKNPTGYCHISLDLFKLAREANPAPKSSK